MRILFLSYSDNVEVLYLAYRNALPTFEKMKPQQFFTKTFPVIQNHSKLDSFNIMPMLMDTYALKFKFYLH